MDLLPLFLDNYLQILCLILVKINLLPKCTTFDFEVINLLLHEVFVLLKLRAHALETLVIVLLLRVHLSVIVDFYFKFISFLLDLFHGFVGKL